MGKRLINLNRNTVANDERLTVTKTKRRRKHMTSSVQLGQYSEKIRPAYTPPPEDRYVLKLDDWDEPKRSAYADDETGEYPLRINLKFKVVKDIAGDDEFAGKDVNKWVGLDLNPNDKGSIWHVLCALDPENEPEPESQIESYRGKLLIGDVEHNTKANKQGVMTTYANVGKVRANKKPKAGVTSGKNPLLNKDDDE